MTDREKLIDTLENIGIYEVTMNAEPIAEALIANGVTVREKGEWIHQEHEEYGDLYRCSLCGVLHMDYTGRGNFCPNCGAKMDGEKG